LAFEYITNLVRPCSGKFADELIDLWEDYEHGRTPEGQFMKEMDKFECLTQAFGYEQRTFGEKQGLEEFQGLTSKIKSPEALGWLKDLQKERTAHFNKRQQRLPVIFISGMLINASLTSASN
jgi:5'-deoxynucleotidase YfbR-like HD superfamily hydrolase